MKKIYLYLLMALMIISSVCAAEISISTDRLNYYLSQSHTVNIVNSGTEAVQVNLTLPAGWTYVSGCSNVGTKVICNLAPSGADSFVMTSPSSDPNYLVTTFTASMNNTYTANDLSFIKITDNELFHTLVEFGRGRGNYFFDSFGGLNLSGSGRSAAGCPYLPNGTMFELNFLHKILNIKQYFVLSNADAVNASFTCSYPQHSVVRVHLDTNVQKTATEWVFRYFIAEISGSWERMGYLGMDFEQNAFNVGDSILINCTNITYNLPAAHGSIQVPQDSFTLYIRNKEPFTTDATAFGTMIGNGTQEVEILYTITNNEVYSVDGVSIDILAPPYAKFIGTRGELWGTATDSFRIEKNFFAPGETYELVLVAKFDTSYAPGLTSINLSRGVEIKYTTCWEANAYNPVSYIQQLKIKNGTPVNMSKKVETIKIINILININSTVLNINNLAININNTVSNIYNLEKYINASIANISYKVWNYYSRNLTYYPPQTGGGVSGGGGAIACRWDQAEWYNDSLSNSPYNLVYGARYSRVDYPGLGNVTADAFRTCYRVSDSAATANDDVLEMHVCNNYDGSGDPFNEPGCSIVDILSHDKVPSVEFTWVCSEILSKEVVGKNVSILFTCSNCAAGDAWKIAKDPKSKSDYSFNSTDSGSTWVKTRNESLVEFDWCVPIDFGKEVWTYNNRTLTYYNFSDLYAQFNCTLGASTNKMCELLYAINLTTTEMKTTINIMNNTVNVIKGNTEIIINDTTIIRDLLNCNTTVDTPLCDWVKEINGSIYDIKVMQNNTYNLLQHVNVSIYVMNKSMYHQFNITQNNLTYVIELIKNISFSGANFTLGNISFNCTNFKTPSGETICDVIGRIDNRTYEMNQTLDHVLNVVVYINGTRWGNYSAKDIYESIQNQTRYFKLILYRISQLEEFDNELVFLVTDSFGLQQQAKKALDNGQLTDAAAKLAKANQQLTEATNRINAIQSKVNVTETDAGSSGNWLNDNKWWLLAIATVALVIYYLTGEVEVSEDEDDESSDDDADESLEK